jgi:two-component system response regulator NreC
MEARLQTDYVHRARRAGARTAAAYLALTEREREVLRLVAEGHTNQEIADRLIVSVKTVETHRAHVMSKLGLQTRAELVQYALREGYLTPEAGST